MGKKKKKYAVMGLENVGEKKKKKKKKKKKNAVKTWTK